ncbi:Nn.00g026650.m01.CDS01 [Neocucurbitaria sp. VM-36]
MQPSRRGRPNRQPREETDSSFGRGRGNGNSSGRGFGRGRNTNPPSHRPQRPRPEYHSVPAFASLQPGTPVSVILKADQASGHRVSGIVSDLLTRGDHPRGVKVRLRDGRVGRVQGLVSLADGERGEALVGGAEAGLGRNGEGDVGSGRGGGGSGRVAGRMERDVREDDEYFYQERRAADVGLFAALEEADRRDREKREGVGSAGVGGIGNAESELATCPVCGEFEGDEAAVAHHVESHFGD